ncbi:AgmX/PglI C-terminal domain-containing protein [Pyxidicoccus parkwayensis]|uniref:AgmX/PglI C-terminal domain-containing protein n=1 Tax=Pyxidicoccus parkwayensis TaxID=2813578 RepID=A0ABX7NNH0_9BACT|nr:AgmX/PglI C-terminal domain-containing protein [Pyxidicoccus parkwaysis]QSQ19963.1 AgmX/PglI C-terminal domain-containing protein [Pyxidicoccus parkwaysis]
MANPSVIRWAVIPLVSLGILVLAAALSLWLTRPQAPRPEAPPPQVAEQPDPSIPPLEKPAVVPPPPFPSHPSQLPTPPTPTETAAPSGARRVAEVEPVIESTTGRITPEDVRVAIRSVTPLVQECFEDAAQRNRGPQTVRLRFTVEGQGEAGQMTGGELLASSIPDPMVQACVLDSLLDARFPAPPGGGKATVVYPFEFRVLGEAGR